MALAACKPIQVGAECTNQAVGLGDLSTPTECARAAANRSGCGDVFMFSSAYPSWGCRCCVVDDEPLLSPNWALHSISDCGVSKTKDFLEGEISRLSRENSDLNERTMYDTTSERRVSKVHSTLREVVETLRRERSKLQDPVFAVAGTLIGALRSQPGGMMRWDDDVDLGVNARSLEDVHDALKSNPRLSWRRHGQFYTYDYGPANDTELTVEIFGLGWIEDKWHILKPDRKNVEGNFAGNYFFDDEITELVPCSFWDIELQCPSGGMSYVQRTYGKEALSKASVYNHRGTKYRPIEMGKEDINKHVAYFPAMTRDLMSKLHFDVETSAAEDSNR
ncbi:hypothetical protein ACHAWF_008614 [Thalassiosira exigua]